MIQEILQKKIDASIRLLQSIGKAYDGVIEIAYSGGKDSDVILQLAKEAGINYEAIYKNTTIDPPGTLAHVKKMGARIIQPKETFFQLVARKGLPSMRRRFCCEVLKEYKVLDKCVIGVRKEESTARAKRYNEPTQCRWYGAKKEENRVEQIMPILDWTNDDVKEYIIDRNIKLAPVYLDGGGKIDITKRLGCMCCPLQSAKKRIESFKQYPNMVKAYIRAAQKFLDKPHKNKRYADVYEWFARDVFYQSSEEFYSANAGFFPKPNYKEMLETIFKIKFK